MQFSSLRRVLRLAAMRLWLFLPICLLAVDTVWAQPATKSVAPPTAAPKNSTKTPKPKPPATSPQTVEDGKWIFLPGLDGQRIPVPSDLWKDFLRWQATQQAPPFHVTSVSLEGRVVGNHAVLDARVEIHVQRTDDWVPVMLRMRTGNTVLTSPVTYRGPGESRPDTRMGNVSDGLRWWLKGRGLHELSFRLSVPVLREHPGRRLQLDLPTPAAAGTKMWRTGAGNACRQRTSPR